MKRTIYFFSVLALIGLSFQMNAQNVSVNNFNEGIVAMSASEKATFDNLVFNDESGALSLSNADQMNIVMSGRDANQVQALIFENELSESGKINLSQFPNLKYVLLTVSENTDPAVLSQRFIGYTGEKLEILYRRVLLTK